MDSQNELKEVMPSPIFEPILSFIFTKCNTDKPVSDFYKNKLCARGHQALCKKCHEASYKLPKNQPSTSEPKPSPTSKTCSKCKETKSLEEFNNCKRNKDGKNGQCRICHNGYFTERVTAPRKKYFEPFNTERKNYILSHDPNDYKQYENQLGTYRKYPLPLKYFECYLLYNKQDNLVDRRHKPNLEFIAQYETWINSEEFIQYSSWLAK